MRGHSYYTSSNILQYPLYKLLRISNRSYTIEILEGYKPASFVKVDNFPQIIFGESLNILRFAAISLLVCYVRVEAAPERSRSVMAQIFLLLRVNLVEASLSCRQTDTFGPKRFKRGSAPGVDHAHMSS